ncbi:restriction endonuclease subunit S, partial [Anabaena sp. UHCC 0451]|uniref:restriction endonuclease subunit S n=1 Tax=Anabaena sp. UHCC 0451 TaxID=2055235 RepID=UPI002B1F43EF
ALTKPKKDDVLFSIIGTIGEPYLMQSQDIFGLSSSVSILRPNQAVIFPKYLYYWIQGFIFQDSLYGIKGGVAQSYVSLEMIISLPLNYPPLPTQQKIAAILSNYDDLIENNTRRIKILEEMAQTLYHEWFVKFRFPGHEQVNMVESDLGLIPEGWEVKNLGNIVIDIIDYRGKTPKKLGGDWSESGITAISALNVKAGKLINLEKSKFISEDLYKKWMKSELKQGDILMTSEAPLGELYFLVREQKFCLSQRLYSIRANHELIKPEILYFALSSPLIQGEIIARQSGTTVLGIRQTELRKVPIVIPPIQLQINGAYKLEQFLKAIDVLQQKNKNLQKTRDLLLPKLISGEIDVENLEIDTGNIAA